MKPELIGLSQRYAAALRKHLKRRRRSSPQPALKLGRQAVALGLRMLDLARVHESALAGLETLNGRKDSVRQAEIFFGDANTPIMEMHLTARQRQAEFNRANGTLNRRTAELAAANRRLRRCTAQRQGAEAALKKSSKHQQRLLKESSRLQKSLRHLTHRHFSAQEKERQTVSTHLQNEIAQTLLGINVRLLNLRSVARGKTASLTKYIVSTQRLVEESVLSINQFASELDLAQPTTRERPVTSRQTQRATGSKDPRVLPTGDSLEKPSKKPLMTRYPTGAGGAMIRRRK